MPGGLGIPGGPRGGARWPCAGGAIIPGGSAVAAPANPDQRNMLKEC